MFKKGQLVRSLVNGAEFEVARDQNKFSSRFCIKRVVQGVEMEDWKDADRYELVVADAEEAFDPESVSVDVEEGEEPEGDVEFKVTVTFDPTQPADIVQLGEAMHLLFGESDFETVDPLKVKWEELKAELEVPKKRADWRMFYDNSSARRKDHPVTEGFLKYFPAAVRLVSEVSRLGNEKHRPNATKLAHARGVSGDHLDCAGRHLMDADTVDGDSGLIEAVNAIWRLCAYVQEKCEREYGWPKAPNAEG